MSHFYKINDALIETVFVIQLDPKCDEMRDMWEHSARSDQIN